MITAKPRVLVCTRQICRVWKLRVYIYIYNCNIYIYIGVFPRFPRFSPHPFQVRNPKEGQDDLIAPLKGAYELEQGLLRRSVESVAIQGGQTHHEKISHGKTERPWKLIEIQWSLVGLTFVQFVFVSTQSSQQFC